MNHLLIALAHSSSLFLLPALSTAWPTTLCWHSARVSKIVKTLSFLTQLFKKIKGLTCLKHDVVVTNPPRLPSLLNQKSQYTYQEQVCQSSHLLYSGQVCDNQMVITCIVYSLASPAMGHGDTCLPQLTTIFFSALWPVQSLTATICR